MIFCTEDSTFIRCESATTDGVLKEVQRQGYGSGRLNVRGEVTVDLVMGNVIRDGYLEVTLVAGQVASR